MAFKRSPVRPRLSPPQMKKTNSETNTEFVFFFSRDFFGVRFKFWVSDAPEYKTTAGITISIPAFSMPFYLLPFDSFAFRLPFVAQLKAEVNGKNCTPLCLVAFALCARLLLKTLIIPRVRLAIEFGSFFIYATILSFFVDFGDCDFNSHLRLLFSVLLRLCRKANKNGGIKCCI